MVLSRLNKKNMIIQDFKGIWHLSEISELNKNDAGFKEKSENPRSTDQSNWHGKRLQTR